MPSPFSQISDVVKTALERTDDQPHVTEWPDNIDTSAILEAADDVVVDGAPAGSWAGQMADRAADIASKYEAEHDLVSPEMRDAAAEVVQDVAGNAVHSASSQIMGTIKDVGAKLIDAIEARIEHQDEVVEDTVEDDIYEAAPAEPVEADDDPYDNDN